MNYVFSASIAVMQVYETKISHLHLIMNLLIETFSHKNHIYSHKINFYVTIAPAF
jgi:hypothetical protein